MNVADFVIPLLSLLVGSLITYAVNVRLRRRSYVEDLFNQAIAAVSAADASVEYTSSFGKPDGMSDADYAQLRSWLVSEGIKNWSTKLGEANLALARVVPYRPEVESRMPFSADTTHRGAHRELIRLLRQGPTR